ncbi:MAG: AI-2E family transporter [Eubacterium sp.]|nr:AI-2E family transporter [Eubacterium sp.]
MRWYEKEQVKKTILLAGVTLAVYLSMRYLLPMVIPFLLGAFLAMLLNPVVRKIEEKTGKGRSVISMLVVIVVLGAVGTACFLIGRTACTQLAALVKNAESIEGGVREIWCGCCDRLERSLGVQIGEAEELFLKVRGRVVDGFRSSTLPYLLKNSMAYAKAVFSILGVGLVSVISGMLILTDYPMISAALRKSEAGKLAIRIKQHTKEAGGTYIKAQIVILLVISLICVAGLFLTGNSYALLAGMGIGVCDALPFIGTGTIFVPWMVLNIINGKYVLAAVYGVLYLVCSFVRQFLEPRLIGERLGYPPIAVLMSIYIGMHVYGAPGVILGPVSAFLIYELYTALL